MNPSTPVECPSVGNAVLQKGISYGAGIMDGNGLGVRVRMGPSLHNTPISVWRLVQTSQADFQHGSHGVILYFGLHLMSSDAFPPHPLYPMAHNSSGLNYEVIGPFPFLMHTHPRLCRGLRWW